MEKKTKDCVFALGLLILGMYVLYESWNILGRAARPPYNIKDFSISPGMLPMVLGCGLIIFCIALLIATLRGGDTSLGNQLALAWNHFTRAIRTPDVISMIVSTIFMFIYTFFIIGTLPYWLGAAVFLIGLMLYLRASKVYIIVLSSGVSIAIILLLFQNVFRTTLP